MRWIFFALALGMVAGALAVDVDPSRRTVPEKFTNPPGKRFSIFSGDPERVQKANEVNVLDFSGSVEVLNKEISLSDIKSTIDRKPTLDLKFRVRNTSKRAYTLSFPDAQRYDVMIRNEKDEIIYVWSDDKMFVKEIGKTFLNKDETISFNVNPPIFFSSILTKLSPGAYTVTIVLCNYPEVQGTTTFTVKP